jgi:hypothetical protein
MRILLNADGAEVVSIDEAADCVEVNLDLLRFQFGLDRPRDGLTDAPVSRSAKGT